MEKRNQRSYTAEYRRDAVALAQEVCALKAENAQLRKEREILEGATAFFASRQKKCTDPQSLDFRSNFWESVHSFNISGSFYFVHSYKLFTTGRASGSCVIIERGDR